MELFIGDKSKVTNGFSLYEFMISWNREDFLKLSIRWTYSQGRDMQLLPIEETADVVIFCPRVDQVDFGALNSAAVLVAFI